VEEPLKEKPDFLEQCNMTQSIIIIITITMLCFLTFHRHQELSLITFNQALTGKNFEMEFRLKNGSDFSFSQIEKEYD